MRVFTRLVRTTSTAYSAIARLSYRRGVCLSVGRCVCVCLLHCCIVSKRRKLIKITKSSLWAASLPQKLYFLVTKFRVAGWGNSLSTKTSRKNTFSKNCYFTVIDSISMKTAADGHILLLLECWSADAFRGYQLLISITIKRLWTKMSIALK